MRGTRTLGETERTVAGHLAGMPLDLAALAALQNLHRAAAAVRRRVEQTALREAGLSWTAFTVLWTLWLHGPSESRAVAAEVGVSRATLSGVAATLERRALLRRHPDPGDRRLAVFEATDDGMRLVADLLPGVGAAESDAVGCLDAAEKDVLGDLLRRVAGSLARSA